jgi:LEA14-like dessication related protein
MSPLNRFARTIVLAISIIFLVSCSSNGVLPESPEVTIQNVEIVELGINKQTFLFNLNAYNPNNFGLPLQGVEFDLGLSEVNVGSGFSNQSLTLTSLTDTVIPVRVETNLVETVDNFKTLFLTGGLKIEYQLSGKLKLVGESIGIPFTVNGKLLE